MPAPAPSRPTGPIDAERLAAIAEVVELGLVLEPGDPAHLVRVRTGPTGDLGGDELELGLRAIEGAHPLDDLAGFTAPADWAALGVVATGRARPLGDPSSTGAGHPCRPGQEGGVPVRSVHLVARSGAWASRCSPFGDATDPTLADCGEPGGGVETPAGRIDDALRRALDLPTAPPPGPTTRLWATQWLDALVEAAAGSPSRRRRLRPLAPLLGAHPVVGALDLDPQAIDVTDLVIEADRLAAWRDWPALRRACAGGLWTGGDLTPALAAWLDDGAFARWVLGAWPELGDLRDALAALLAPSALSVVDDALAAWGLHETP